MNAELIGLVGAGTMGAGLATLAVGHGLPVVLVETDEQVRARVAGTVRQNLRMARLLGGLPRAETADGELTVTDSVADLAAATVVVECVTEVPATKAAVLAEVSTTVAPGTLLLTNTSGIPVDELAGSVARPEDLAGAHFMNPPYLIKAVELVRGPRTAEAALDRARTVLAALTREPILVGDGPGFVINRILQRVINEAARIVQDGVADPTAVDALFTGCLGHRTGPLATGDLIGLDNVVDSLRVLHERTGDPGYQPCQLLLDKVGRGHLGRKTGQGFHVYQGEMA